MPGYKHNNDFAFLLHGGGSGLRLNEGPYLKLSSVMGALYFSLAQSIMVLSRVSLSLAVCESIANFFVSPQSVKLI